MELKSYLYLQSIAASEFKNLNRLGLLDDLDWSKLDGRYNCIYAMITGSPNSKETLQLIAKTAPALIDNSLGCCTGKIMETDYIEPFIQSFGKTIIHHLNGEIVDTTTRHEYFITPLEALTPYPGACNESEKWEFIQSLIKSPA